MWINPIFDVLISSKLPAFASETAQAPSALLEIFHTKALGTAIRDCKKVELTEN